MCDDVEVYRPIKPKPHTTSHTFDVSAFPFLVSTHHIIFMAVRSNDDDNMHNYSLASSIDELVKMEVDTSAPVAPTTMEPTTTTTTTTSSSKGNNNRTKSATHHKNYNGRYSNNHNSNTHYQTNGGWGGRNGGLAYGSQMAMDPQMREYYNHMAVQQM